MTEAEGKAVVVDEEEEIRVRFEPVWKYFEESIPCLFARCAACSKRAIASCGRRKGKELSRE